MHVVQLIPSLAVGGMEVMMLHLAAWLSARSISVETICFEDPLTLSAELTTRGVRVTRMPLPRFVWRLYPAALLRHLGGRRDVVLHGHMYAWHKATAVARWRNVACVYTQHGAEEAWIRKEWREMRRSARATQATVAVSDEIYRFLVHRLAVPRELAYLVPNGIPDARRPKRPVAWGAPIPPGARLVGMVGRLAVPKDPDTLIEAVRIVRRRVPEAHLVFVGSGPDEERLRRVVRDRGDGFVHLLGERSDVPDLLAHLEVFVLSSFSEGHSIAALEAMSAERPIVATAVGGSVDLLDHGRSGVLTPAGDAAPMAEAIERLLLDRDAAGRLGSAARRRYLERFSLDRMGEAYLRIYEDALARRRAG
jgi:glycosyltransferase involved in cell wall biosynthesis